MQRVSCGLLDIFFLSNVSFVTGKKWDLLYENTIVQNGYKFALFSYLEGENIGPVCAWAEQIPFRFSQSQIDRIEVKETRYSIVGKLYD